MATQTRSSGIRVETRGGAALAGATPALRRVRLGQLRPPALAATRRRAAPVQKPLTEAEAIVNAIEAQDLELVDTLTIVPPPPGAALAPARRGPKVAAEVDLTVPAEGETSAVVLLQRDGVYEWHLPQPAAPAPASLQRRGTAAARRSLVFRLPIAPAAGAAPAAILGRRGLATAIRSRVVAYVFRFVATPVLGGIVRVLENGVREDLVHLPAPEPERWQFVADAPPLRLPTDRPARVLLLVHGTFSSTVGSFGALAGQADGRSFLAAALRHYDVVLGYDHRTLSLLPSENAQDLARRLEQLAFAQPPVVDAIGFSRGGLVLRSLVEHVLPKAQLRMHLRRAVFVACTNGGTELANPDNWHRLADRYTNLAAAGARAAALVPGFAATGVLLASAIRGVGVLVKVLATAAISENAVPGLAAMRPDGEFVREINSLQPGQPGADQAYYCAITSDFDPDQVEEALPPGLLLKLADKAADALHGRPSDLVVPISSMTEIDPGHGAFIREVHAFGTNGTVHHCAYFSQPDTARKLGDWLELRGRYGDSAGPRSGPSAAGR